MTRGIHERFYGLDADGRSAREIGMILGVSQRTVVRWRRVTGRLKRPAPRPASQEQLALALQLLQDGASRSDVARTVGLCPTTLHRHFPEYRWTAEECVDYMRMVRQLAA